MLHGFMCTFMHGFMCTLGTSLGVGFNMLLRFLSKLAAAKPRLETMNLMLTNRSKMVLMLGTMHYWLAVHE